MHKLIMRTRIGKLKGNGQFVDTRMTLRAQQMELK